MSMSCMPSSLDVVTVGEGVAKRTTEVGQQRA
jgi:hypothetical protein